MKVTQLLFLFLIPGFLYTQNWTQLSSLPDTSEGRNHAISFGIKGFGYLLTGNGSTSGQLEDLLRYHPDEDRWESMEDFPGGKRGFAYGVTNGEKAYVGFGRYYDDSLGMTIWHKDLWSFDPETESWTEVAECPCEARIHPALVATSSKVFVGLGRGEDSGDMNDWWEYDIATDTWSQKPDFPATERHHPYYFGINDQAYVGFGHHSQTIFDDFYHYDPETEIWTPTAQFAAEGRVAGTQFDYNGKGYVLSGQGEDHANLDTGEFWEYDPINDIWSELEPHPGTGRWAPATFILNDQLYFMTGQIFQEDDDGNFDYVEKKDLWVYDLDPVVSSIEAENLAEIKIYPNPAQNEIHIVSGSAFGPAKLRITNSLGQVIRSVDFPLPNKSISLDISELKQGHYILSLHRENGIQNKGILIQR